MRFNAFTAMDIIRDFYEGKKDLNGVPAFNHPFDVGWRAVTAKFKDKLCEGDGMDEKLFMCGLLHDLVEDCQDTHEWTFQRLKDIGCPRDVLIALELLTHEKGTPYMDYVKRICDSGNQMAIRIKVADLQSNLNRNGGRYPKIYEKHQKALQYIRNAAKVSKG